MTINPEIFYSVIAALFVYRFGMHVVTVITNAVFGMRSTGKAAVNRATDSASDNRHESRQNRND